ncbi:MAG: hypothetical protein GY758_20205 [Fuerstiella sp.]|nr:hypothetical protein [Fuerstiella sp.]MCP4511445.1 hypothetical protein [Fuerstiella sp.]
MRTLITTLCVALLLLTANSHAAEQPKYILFFGNSFTGAKDLKTVGGVDGIPGLVQEIAVAAGLPRPMTQRSISGGKTLKWHIENSTRAIAKPNRLTGVPKRSEMPEGFQWDHAVFQEQSSGPSTAGGRGNTSIDRFFATAIELSRQVRAHSPKARIVLYETWAYSPQHSWYPDTLPNPQEFQKQLRDNYSEAGELIRLDGIDAVVAPCGDVWEALKFPISFYTGDKKHPSAEGALLNGLILFRTIYQRNTSNIELGSLAKRLKITADRLMELQAAADKVTIEN